MPKFDPVVSRLATLDIGGQRLETVDGFGAAGIGSEGLSRVLELNVWEVWVLWVERAKLMHVNLEVGTTEGAIQHVTDTPQPPINLSPRLQL